MWRAHAQSGLCFHFISYDWFTKRAFIHHFSSLYFWILGHGTRFKYIIIHYGACGDINKSSTGQVIKLQAASWMFLWLATTLLASFLMYGALTHIITLNQWVTSVAHFVLHPLHKQNTEAILCAVIKQTQGAYFINTSWQIWIRADVKPKSVFC